MIGAGLGALLVTDHTIGWGFFGALPALALIPSAVGGLWGGRHLSRVHVELPRALRETPVARADKVNLGGPGLVILAGSVLRLTLGTAVLSGLCMLASPWTSGTIATSLFVGFGCLALATLFVSLLVSLGRMAWAFVGVSAAVLCRGLDRAAGGARATGQRPDRGRPDRVGRRTSAAGEALPAARPRARDRGLDRMTRLRARRADRLPARVCGTRERRHGERARSPRRSRPRRSWIFKGSGTKRIGTIKLRRTATLRWRKGRGTLRITGTRGFRLLETRSRRGSITVRRGTYRRLTASAPSSWRITIRERR